MSIIQAHRKLHELVSGGAQMGAVEVFQHLKNECKQNPLFFKGSDRQILLYSTGPKEAAEKFLYTNRPILGTSMKVNLGMGYGYKTKVMYGAAAKLSGFEACPHRTEACTAGCLSIKSGNITFHFVGTILKIWAYKFHREAFTTKVVNELRSFNFGADTDGYGRAVRMNGTTDILFTEIWKLAQEMDIMCYEYTKVAKWMKKRDGVHRTFSISESGLMTGIRMVCEGKTASIIVPGRKKDYSRACEWFTANEIPWVDGDRHDLCFLDTGKLRVLKAKSLKDSPMIWTIEKLKGQEKRAWYREDCISAWKEEE